LLKLDELDIIVVILALISDSRSGSGGGRGGDVEVAAAGAGGGGNCCSGCGYLRLMNTSAQNPFAIITMFNYLRMPIEKERVFDTKETLSELNDAMQKELKQNYKCSFF
jgi:hypothetical protein